MELPINIEGYLTPFSNLYAIVYMSCMPLTHHRLAKASGGDSDVSSAAEDSVFDLSSNLDSSWNLDSDPDSSLDGVI